MSEQQPIWILMPIAGAPELTPAAIADCLDQSIPTRLLLLGQGLDRPFRERLERIAEADPARIFCVFFDPPLPSLAAVWNHGLNVVWRLGGEVALVVNNDVRLHQYTVECLARVLPHETSLFVSAVGVTELDFAWAVEKAAEQGTYDPHRWASAFHDGPMYPKGGPDFSCFLISKYGHAQYPFDEGFIPAYCEDLDCHRRYMLGGDGDRIFSINLPYLHYASGTLKSLTPEARAAKERAIAGSRAYYAKKWGGPVNQERFLFPFDPTSDRDDVTTPQLQAHPPRPGAPLAQGNGGGGHAATLTAPAGPDPLRAVLGDPPTHGGVRSEPAGGRGAGCAAGGAAGAELGRLALAGSGAPPFTLGIDLAEEGTESRTIRTERPLDPLTALKQLVAAVEREDNQWDEGLGSGAAEMDAARAAIAAAEPKVSERPPL